MILLWAMKTNVLIKVRDGLFYWIDSKNTCVEWESRIIRHLSPYLDWYPFLFKGSIVSIAAALLAITLYIPCAHWSHSRTPDWLTYSIIRPNKVFRKIIIVKATRFHGENNSGSCLIDLKLCRIHYFLGNTNKKMTISVSRLGSWVVEPKKWLNVDFIPILLHVKREGS